MKIPKAKRLLPIAFCALLVTHCSCDFFGTTGSLLISENDEVKLGTQFDTHLRTNDTAKTEYPLFVPKNADETAFQEYVIGLANGVLAKVPKNERPDYPFTFTLIDKDVENAFAVPGGYVYIYTGIISKMRDESELVGV
ncbi:MAG: M48 family metalloprotease, partial [Fibrobacterota bacterium]|nr:M48 family metalloprotease [Fibrobacterota bacterium]